MLVLRTTLPRLAVEERDVQIIIQLFDQEEEEEPTNWRLLHVVLVYEPTAFTKNGTSQD
jgi:hypothetical protein